MKFAAVLLVASAATSLAAPTPAVRGAAIQGAVGGATMGATFSLWDHFKQKHDEKEVVKQRNARSLIGSAVHGAVSGFGAGAGFAAFNSLKEHHDQKKAEEAAEKARQN